MPPVKIELDRADPLREAGRAFGFMEHPTVRQHREHAMLLVGYRIADRLAGGPDNARHLNACSALCLVPFESDTRKLRVLDGLDNGRKDLEHRACLLVLAGQDIEQRVPLRIVSTRVDDWL